MVNKHLPRTFGDGVIHESHIDVMVGHDEELPEIRRGALLKEEKEIGRLISEHLVEDGATLQLGLVDSHV